MAAERLGISRSAGVADALGRRSCVFHMSQGGSVVYTFRPTGPSRGTAWFGPERLRISRSAVSDCRGGRLASFAIGKLWLSLHQKEPGVVSVEPRSVNFFPDRVDGWTRGSVFVHPIQLVRERKFLPTRGFYSVA